MSDLIKKFVEAQLTLSKEKMPTALEPKKTKVVKASALVVEPENEIMEAGESLDDRFDSICMKHPRKKVVLDYLQDVIDAILAEDD
jgi:hypothetical protein